MNQRRLKAERMSECIDGSGIGTGDDALTFSTCATPIRESPGKSVDVPSPGTASNAWRSSPPRAVELGHWRAKKTRQRDLHRWTNPCHLDSFHPRRPKSTRCRMMLGCLRRRYAQRLSFLTGCARSVGSIAEAAEQSAPFDRTVDPARVFGCAAAVLASTRIQERVDRFGKSRLRRLNRGRSMRGTRNCNV